jgi:hypothetical protein
MSTTPAHRPQRENVIDLTSEPDIPLTESSHRRDELRTNRPSRPPRFGRDIMVNVVDLDEEPTVLSDVQPSSPEVQFLGSSVRPSDGPQVQSNAMRSPAGTLSFRGANLFDMFRRIGQTGATSAFMRGEETIRQEVALRTRNREFARSFPPMEPLWIDAPPGEASNLPIELDEQLDYRATGFGTADVRRAVHPYQPPSPPPEGFTRIAKEDEIVVCPNCDHELGTGNDPIKRQIWVAKPCGHVGSSISSLFSHGQGR